MRGSEVSTSVVKWSEGPINRMAIIFRNIYIYIYIYIYNMEFAAYMAVSFIISSHIPCFYFV